MEMTSSRQREPATESGRGRIEHLLGRYPDIAADETAEILRFLKKGPILEVGLLSSSDALKPKLDQFRTDHARHFTVGAKGLVIAAVIVVTIVLVSMLLWNVGASR